jgi:hypothetical protein
MTLGWLAVIAMTLTGNVGWAMLLAFFILLATPSGQ